MSYQYFRAGFGRGRFATLVAVKRSGDKRGYATAEWIWSDLFAWKSYSLAPGRCLYWYQSQPNPKTYTGIKANRGSIR